MRFVLPSFRINFQARLSQIICHRIFATWWRLALLKMVSSIECAINYANIAEANVQASGIWFHTSLKLYSRRYSASLAIAFDVATDGIRQHPARSCNAMVRRGWSRKFQPKKNGHFRTYSKLAFLLIFIAYLQQLSAVASFLSWWRLRSIVHSPLSQLYLSLSMVSQKRSRKLVVLREIHRLQTQYNFF